MEIKSLFFDNLTIGQTIFKNTFWLALGEGISKLLRAALLIYAARALGAEEYGEFSFALAFIGLFAIFSALGLPRIVVRELSRDKEKEKELPSIMSLRAFMGFTALAMAVAGSFFVAQDSAIRQLIWILAVYSFFDSFCGFINLFFQARQKMEYESGSKILQAVFTIIFGFGAIFFFPSVKSLSYGYLFASLVSLVSILLFFHFRFHQLRFNLNKNVWKQYLLMSWPLALAGAFAAIYGQMDSVMMGYWGLMQETGWYNAAYRVLGAVFIPFGLISTSFFPALSRAFKGSKDELQKTWNFQMGITIASALPLVAGGIILAPKIIDFVYGPAYVSSALAFQILIIMFSALFFYNPFYQALLVHDQQKKFFWVSLLAAAINFFLNLILIPKFSLYGAAAASVVTAFSALFLYVLLAWRFTSIKIFNLNFLLTAGLSVFSTLIMYFVISRPFIYNFSVLISITIGSLVYLFVFFGLKFSVNHLYLYDPKH